MATGYAGAVDRIAILVRWQPVDRHLSDLARRAPDRAARALARAVAWWHAESVRHAPVHGGPRRGRGMLRKSMQPYVRRSGDRITGGIVANVPYAIWLAAGTRHIAGGRVMQWHPGMPTIQMWPAKMRGGAPSGELPIILPWQAEARERFSKELTIEVLGGK